jgi:hypothetical protein
VREDKIDPSVDSDFVSVIQRKQLGRFQFPLGRHSRPAFHFCQLAPQKISQCISVTPPGGPPIRHGSAAARAKIDNPFSESMRSVSYPFAHLVARRKIDKGIFFFRTGNLREPVVHPCSSGCIPLVQGRLLIFDAEICFQPD